MNVVLRLHFGFVRPVGWLVTPCRSSSAKDGELLALRHEVAVLRSPTHSRPQPDWADRAVCAAFVPASLGIGITRRLRVEVREQ